MSHLVNGDGLDDIERRVRDGQIISAVEELAMVAEIRRLRGMIRAANVGDCPELPCTECGASAGGLGLGCGTCRSWRTGGAS